MILKRTNDIDGKEYSMELPFTVEQFYLTEEMRENTGALIQDVYPTLTADQREFIKTGITPELWEKMFGND